MAESSLRSKLAALQDTVETLKELAQQALDDYPPGTKAADTHHIRQIQGYLAELDIELAMARAQEAGYPPVAGDQQLTIIAAYYKSILAERQALDEHEERARLLAERARPPQ
jgi:hypothetical protein